MYHKCINPDCEYLVKRHRRCGRCRKAHRYKCNLCNIDLPDDHKIMCTTCSYNKHKEFEKVYQVEYRKAKKSQHHNNILLH